MAKQKQQLFGDVAPAHKLCDAFKTIRSQNRAAPTRWMLENVFEQFPDSDGNFVEQFQTSGFDQRILELYTFAYFSRSGFTVDRSQTAPDFIVTRNGLSVAVETTTVNRSTSGVMAAKGQKIDDLDPDQLQDRVVYDHASFHPFSSQTWNTDLEEIKPSLAKLAPHFDPSYAVEPVTKSDFETVIGELEFPESAEAEGWYADHSKGFFGAIFKVASNGKWLSAVLARNENFKFYVLATQDTSTSREQARLSVINKISSLVRLPQRIFPERNEEGVSGAEA